MQAYINEYFRYVILIFMALYTYESFAALRKEKRPKDGIYQRQKLLIFLILLFSFAELTVSTYDLKYLIFYGFVQLFLLSISWVTEALYENADSLLTNNMCLLLGVGFCVIARLSFDKALRQFVIALASLVIALILPLLLSRLDIWKKLSWLYALLGILSLGVVLVLGQVTYGSKISYTIAGVTFQPSELVKLLFIFFLAAVLWKDASMKRVLLASAGAGIQVLILVFSRDLGSALIFYVGFVAVVFLATGKLRYLLAGVLGGVGASCLCYQVFDHVRIRVLAWQDPWTYINDEGYQVAQSLFAIINGGWFGAGLGQGSPLSIPDVEADMIFSAICEELGVIFGICLIMVCLSCFIAMMNTAVGIKDSFYRLVVYGLGVIYIFQVFLTIGGGIKLIPLTGVTLPLISYGGSSILTTMLMFYIVQGISIRQKREGVSAIEEAYDEEGRGDDVDTEDGE